MKHGKLTFGYRLDDYEWQEIKQSWERLVNYDPYENDWNDK